MKVCGVNKGIDLFPEMSPVQNPPQSPPRALVPSLWDLQAGLCGERLTQEGMRLMKTFSLIPFVGEE